MAGTPGQNVNTAAARGLGFAGQQAAGVAGFRPQTLANANIAQFQNPFTQQVTNRTLSDLARANQIALNNVRGSATQAGAFGGSRLGVAEAETNRNFADVAANTLANLNLAGFDNAQRAAQFDIGNDLNAAGLRLQGAGQLGNLANLGFGIGRQIGQDQLQQGIFQQAQRQRLLDLARQQFQGFTGAPNQALDLPLRALGATPVPQTTKTSDNGGGLLGLLAGVGTFASGIAPLFCWVAREVYGADNPAWLEFREWMFTKAPGWLRRAYVRHGERWAGVVRRNPWMKRILRPIMDMVR